MLIEKMYIQKAEIKNIRSIIDFEIKFKNPAGWHVLIGDNGSGKSTIIRSLAFGLVGAEESGALRINEDEWVTKNSEIGKINLHPFDNTLPSLNIAFERHLSGWILKESSNVFSPKSIIDSEIKNFSAAYGPYRRFEGGSSEWEEVYKNPSLANLAAHLSVFNESVALTEPIEWLKELRFKALEGYWESENTIRQLFTLINSEDFLPHKAQIESVGSDGVYFKDGYGTIITVNQMSDGYRSILSMTFELIRQLVRVYGSELVFKNIEKGEMFIDLPGVVLVDEIDAHLHPTWQTRIGNWFLKYFPRLQFIVTTHSPLVCRAAENGSIWRLAAPGSDEESGEITGLDRERLIYGNILDAYGTEVFGSDVSISEESVKKQEEMVKLSKKKMLDDILPKEKKKLEDLKKVFTTDAPIEL